MATHRDQPTADPDDPSAPLIIVNPRAARLRRAAPPGHHGVHRARGPVPDGPARARSWTVTWPRPRPRSPGSARPAPPLVVAAGGDGTIRDAAAALAGRPIPLAIVPGGTGNVLASRSGSGASGPAIQAIRHGPERMIDLGQATWGRRPGDGGARAATHSSWSPAAWAWTPGSWPPPQHEWKRRMLFGAYVGAAIRELTRLRTAVFRIIADGEKLEIRGYLALIANAGDIVPGRIGPRRPIDPADGRLQLMVLGAENPLDGLRGAASLLLSQDELDGRVIRRAVSEVRVEAEPAQPIEIDGDDQPPGLARGTGPARRAEGAGAGS